MDPQESFEEDIEAETLEVEEEKDDARKEVKKLTQVYKKQEMSFSLAGPKSENFTPTLPNN